MALECPPFSDFVILLVDFNAYRGNDTETWWGVTGRNGLPNVVLLDFWANNGSSIINTMPLGTRTPWLQVDFLRSASISSGHLGEKRN